MLNPHIFRQYDIRGLVGSDIDADVARAIGRAYGTLLRRMTGTEEPVEAVLGRDNRLTSDELAAAVSAGLRDAGVGVIDVGTVPTPVHSYATAVLGAAGGLQVTGSHNPPDYNGFKMTVAGRSIYGERIQEIFRIIREEDYESGDGRERREEILNRYVADIAPRFALKRPLKVVADCGNGVGSVVVVDLLRALGEKVEVIPLYCESDGTFPNHHPDPVVDENLIPLIDKVRATGADLGVAFDGDADRIGAVDEKGGIVRGDILLLLFALELAERRGADAPVVYDVKCTQALPDVLEKAGIRGIMAKTGHSLIKERMKEEGALIAGELSGHIMFGDDYYGFDDALYAACLLTAIVSRSERSLSERVGEFPQYLSSPEIRYPATEETKFGIVDRAVEHFGREHEVIDVDGARVLFGDGWGLVRASNTEPVIVARYEARDEGRLNEIREQVEGWLSNEGVQVPAASV